jgi:hypothetical protein
MRPGYAEHLHWVTLWNAAKNMELRGQPGKAEKYYVRAKEEAERDASNSIEFEQMLSGLASLYRNEGMDHKAELVDKEIQDVSSERQRDFISTEKRLQIKLANKKAAVGGKQEFPLVETFNELAATYEENERYPAAEKYYLKVADAVKGAYGDKDQSFADCLINLGRVRAEWGVKERPTWPKHPMSMHW